MKYTDNYSDIFAVARFLVREELEEAYRFMTEAQLWNHQLSWEYLAQTADLLTSYNELSRLQSFWRLKHFK